MITETHIKETPTFKSLDSIQQKFILTKKVREDIRLGVDMSGKIGYNNWLEKCSPTERVKGIVNELLNLNK